SPSLHYKPPPPQFSLQAGEQQWHELRLADGKDYGLLGLGHQRVTKKGVHALNFYLMAELTPLNEQILLYRQRLWGGLGGIGLLLLATQILLLRWGLRPLRRVTIELGAIESGSQDSLVGSYPREVHQLTDKINTLLAHERARQTRYRNALADLAHSLKTPLAVLRGASDNPELLGATVEEQSIRMTRIVERQLQRAATSADISTSTAVAVAPLIDRLAGSLCKVYRDKNVMFSNRADPELRFRGDEADLMEVLGNLLDNAFKWCRSRVIIGAQVDSVYLTLSIQDDGPGIHPSHVEKILQRGVRIDESTPGHGIGLAVTADIVEAYQGRIRIEHSVLGGASIILEFLR
ncbi:MAG: ATP-binding protein, partial [Methylococcaceae bacterium]